MATRMQQRRGTAAEWSTANPILGNGEFGLETDTKILKIGDGVTAWNSLPASASYLRSNAKAADAELLDGFNSATAATASTVAVRDTAADITTRLFRSEYAVLNTNPTHIMTQIAPGVGTDNYLRPTTLAQLKTSLGKMNDSELLDGLDSTSFVRHNIAVAAQDLIIGTAAGVVGRLAKGANNTHLVVNASGVLAWEVQGAVDLTSRVAKAGDTMTGRLHIHKAGTLAWGGSGDHLELQGSTSTDVPKLSFHNPGNFALSIGATLADGLRTINQAGTDYANFRVADIRAYRLILGDVMMRDQGDAARLVNVADNTWKPLRAGAMYDNDQRVYSPNNPPPASGMSILGTGNVQVPYASYTAYQVCTFVAPASGRVIVNATANQQVPVYIQSVAGAQTSAQPATASIGVSGLSPGATYSLWAGGDYNQSGLTYAYVEG